MNLLSHRFSQNANKKLSRFRSCVVRAEFLTIFRSYFGRNDDFINSFWNWLTFSLVHTCAIMWDGPHPYLNSEFHSLLAKFEYLLPTATIERKNDNSHNSIIHYITHATGACAVDAVTSSQISLGKQKISIWKTFLILQNFQNPLCAGPQKPKNKLSWKWSCTKNSNTKIKN